MFSPLMLIYCGPSGKLFPPSNNETEKKIREKELFFSQSNVQHSTTGNQRES